MLTPRHIISIESPGFMGWGCSQCARLFNPSDALVGSSLEEMKKDFELCRDRDFAAHVCAKYPRVKNT